jgi:hypothetical protein
MERRQLTLDYVMHHFRTKFLNNPTKAREYIIVHNQPLLWEGALAGVSEETFRLGLGTELDRAYAGLIQVIADYDKSTFPGSKKSSQILSEASALEGKMNGLPDVVLQDYLGLLHRNEHIAALRQDARDKELKQAINYFNQGIGLGHDLPKSDRAIWLGHIMLNRGRLLDSRQDLEEAFRHREKAVSYQHFYGFGASSFGRNHLLAELGFAAACLSDHYRRHGDDRSLDMMRIASEYLKVKAPDHPLRNRVFKEAP